MKMRILAILLMLMAGTSFGSEIKYQNDFQKAELDTLPEDFLLIEGGFAVKGEGNNRFLELPGAPLDTFGVLFGPASKENVSVSARVFGSAKGRRYPVFDVMLGGLNGYKLRVSPAKKQLELYRGDSLKTAVPLEWKAGKWAHLKLQVVKSADAEWRVEGKIWAEGEKEPKPAAITFTEKEEPPAGRAGITAMPFSGTPIRFDDIVVREESK